LVIWNNLKTTTSKTTTIMEILNDITITNSQAQQAANNCQGENAFVVREVTQENWLETRNKFLANVSFNGARSHTSIINVLVWFNQFN
jgi:hypothetical protein